MGSYRDTTKSADAKRAYLKYQKKMVPIIGFELMTYRLQGGCSTN
jgi:hypothetical protein